MGCLGDLLWFLFGGFIMGLSWGVAGLLWCITIVGIPIGMQCFKIAKLSLMPFGAEIFLLALISSSCYTKMSKYPYIRKESL